MDGFQSLLDKKVREAKNHLQEEMNRQLFGEEKMSGNPALRAAIADAYDTCNSKPVYKTATEAAILTESAIFGQYKEQMKETLFKENTLLGLLKEEQGEKAMSDESIALEAVRKRKEKRAEVAVAQVGDYLEAHDWEDGDTIAWTVDFHDTPNKTYHYVALFGGTRWYITGDEDRWTPEELTGHITALALRGTVMSDDFGNL